MNGECRSTTSHAASYIFQSSSVHHLLVFVFLFFDAVFSFSKAEQSARRVAFNSQEERKMFPNHAPPTRFGIESGLRGAPNRAPGCYSPDAVSWRSLLVPMSSVATAALLCGNIQLHSCMTGGHVVVFETIQMVIGTDQGDLCSGTYPNGQRLPKIRLTYDPYT